MNVFESSKNIGLAKFMWFVNRILPVTVRYNFVVTSFSYMSLLFLPFIYFFITSDTNDRYLVPSFRHVAITTSDDKKPCNKIL